MATGVSNGVEDNLHMLPASSVPSFWHSWLSWMYAGVDPSLAGNGGPECAAFVPTSQKLIETIFFITIGVVEICYAWPRLNTVTPKSCVASSSCCGPESLGRRFMLMVMCLTFGAELGFKLASQQMIWILNPCHLVTMMQIYLLVASPSKLVTAVFRIQMHCLNGATIAILFPILNTRTMPFETHIYYIQHGLLLVVPVYLLRLRGVYTVEPLSDYTWVSLTLGLLFIYHWFPLQILALLSLVNLNNMMCPAVSDPFYSRWYRIAAATHQTLLILVHGKVYVYLASRFVNTADVKQPPSPASAQPSASQPIENGSCVRHHCADELMMHDSNGFTKLQ